MEKVIGLVYFLMDFYVALIFIRVIVSWLISFEVLPAYHPTVSRILDILYQATEPAMERIRRVVPLFAGFDFSPIVLVALIWIAQGILINYIAPLLGVGNF